MILVEKHVYFLKHKSDACGIVKNFVTCIERQSCYSFKTLRTDGGT